MSRVRRGKGRASPGQSLVELALVLMILVLILAGLADLGRVLNAYIIITNAAREGARYGCGYPADVDGIRAHAIAEAAGSGVQLSEDDIQVEASGSGAPVTVTITYDVPLITGIIAAADSFQVWYRVTMVAF